MHKRASTAIVAVAVLGLGGAVAQQAAATPAVTHSGTPLVSAAAPAATGVVPGPPQGYVQEAAWLATADAKAYCEAEGKKGISAGRWTAYVCLTEPRGELPLFFQVLYVKK
ncbi:hypothetical protein [Streptomyces afghaniensis]|uniref:hypothetical protein n=1 Tax=Streptomyces afghaniensis TaxID=66865 RepID=UPI00277F9F22|nr:hypothetical protein [Streptomyces afghaniensis]MDQ1017836.1 hypothetical protein [Streptomyces afghaniensis]